MPDPLEVIIMRALEPEDIPACTRIYNHPDIVRESLQPPYVSIAEAKQLNVNSRRNRHIVAEIDGILTGVGTLRIYDGRRAHAAQIGVAVDPDCREQGVGSALMAALIDLGESWYDIRRFELKVFASNTHAIARYERFGFEIEATHRQFALRDGEHADAYTMARLR